MRPEAMKLLRELRWLAQAQRFLRDARSKLERDPNDKELAALVGLVEEVVETEQARLRAA